MCLHILFPKIRKIQFWEIESQLNQERPASCTGFGALSHAAPLHRAPNSGCSKFLPEGGSPMPSKYQEYRQMADTAEQQLTSSYKSWTQFLRTAARLYKYPNAYRLNSARYKI